VARKLRLPKPGHAGRFPLSYVSPDSSSSSAPRIVELGEHYKRGMSLANFAQDVCGGIEFPVALWELMGKDAAIIGFAYEIFSDEVHGPVSVSRACNILKLIAAKELAMRQESYWNHVVPLVSGGNHPAAGGTYPTMRYFLSSECGISIDHFSQSFTSAYAEFITSFPGPDAKLEFCSRVKYVIDNTVEKVATRILQGLILTPDPQVHIRPTMKAYLEVQCGIQNLPDMRYSRVAMEFIDSNPTRNQIDAFCDIMNLLTTLNTVKTGSKLLVKLASQKE